MPRPRAWWDPQGSLRKTAGGSSLQVQCWSLLVLAVLCCALLQHHCDLPHSSVAPLCSTALLCSTTAISNTPLQRLAGFDQEVRMTLSPCHELKQEPGRKEALAELEGHYSPFLVPLSAVSSTAPGLLFCREAGCSKWPTKGTPGPASVICSCLPVSLMPAWCLWILGLCALNTPGPCAWCLRVLGVCALSTPSTSGLCVFSTPGLFALQSLGCKKRRGAPACDDTRAGPAQSP